ncbi:formate dehydrogenase accessory sulfurtransferase FdhD [Paenalcaligenes niemegkensis]|uniref:formate dehydrogenase accessory sulfurtransferase FdhD n=1 Tax=Paenalcaligenes niemegkensis TaxID=2895469 RepID=UPI001EE8124C|nr:formate dehydrogenase accessory sulfurtransferase FdhD [Paenalcaligenes niemegkensis]MCQ9617200.1 formate dehydrogenase accessory sulfurtransferase FdhD [Paenalcaligenes niemegkensis]
MRGLAKREVWRHEPLKTGVAELDLIAVEAPIALQFNGISHAVLLATPQDLEDLAVGFAFTEGIVRDASDIYDVQVHESEQGHIVDIEIASACLQRLKQRRRQLAGRTGCGLCGLESLEEVRRDLPPVATPTAQARADAVFIALEQLRGLQPLHQQTGATHAAGLAQADGTIKVVREDVGRHNALDKLIGHLMRTDGLQHAQEQMIVVSSRASFEMVQKTAAAKVPTLVAVSAPTSFAINLATELNLLLVGFGRAHQFSAYSHPHRLSTT